MSMRWLSAFCAALCFRYGDAGKAQLRGFLECCARKVARFIQFFGERPDFGFGKLPHGFLQERLLFGEIEVQRQAPSIGRIG